MCKRLRWENDEYVENSNRKMMNSWKVEMGG